MHETSDYTYQLPEELIAQTPLDKRDASRLLVLDRQRQRIEHSHFANLPEFLQPGDILVGNDSRVFPARIYGRKVGTGGHVEILLLEQRENRTWRALVGGKRIKEGSEIRLDDRYGKPVDLIATVVVEGTGPIREIQFTEPVETFFPSIGHTPLPPYIHQAVSDPERYQTVYSRYIGSAAAPTAGLHFSPDLLISLRDNGVLFETVTLHIGLDTFKPVSARYIEQHQIHTEWSSLSADSAKRINEAKLAGGRVVAVGTTAVRLLETAALKSAGITGSLTQISQEASQGATGSLCPWRPVMAFQGNTDLFIYPGYQFRVVDALITNFHLPRSSLLMLVSAFAGRQLILDTYRQAIGMNYRFYSFGDAMLIT